jgi:hypothetical protein
MLAIALGKDFDKNLQIYSKMSVICIVMLYKNLCKYQKNENDNYFVVKVICNKKC